MIEKLRLDPRSGDEYKYLDENLISHRSKKEYIQTNILGFCGCGDPDSVMKYVYDQLKKIESGDYGDWSDMPWVFFLYWADHNDFTEHGTSVGGSWLTELGQELMRDIEWCLENEKED